MPPQYKDFSKSVTDILSDDFGEKKFLKTKHSTPSVAGGSGVTVTSEVGVTGFSGKLTGKWKHECGFSFDKVTFDGKGGKYEASYTKLYPGVAVKTTGDLDLSKPLNTIECELTQDMLAGSVKTDTKFDSTTACVVLGQDGLQVGGSVSFKRGDGVQDYPLAIGYGDKKYFAAVSAEDKLRKFGLAARYEVNEQLTVACAGHSGLEFGKGAPNKLEVGAMYSCNSHTTVKGKYSFVDGQKKGNNPGSLEAALNMTPLKKVNFSAGVALPIAGLTDFSSFKYGAGITLG